MRKIYTNRSKIYRIAAVLFAVIFLVSAGFLLLQIWESEQKYASAWGDAENHIEYKGKEYELKQNIESFLVLGLDKFEDNILPNSYNNDRQADFLMLLVFDNEAKTCSALNISRDTMAKIDVLGINGNPIDTVESQIALAHTYGDGGKTSCRNASNAVSDLLLGMKINHYISFTMDAVPIYNDLLGGVEVMVLDDFTSIDDSLVKNQKVTLKGEQALTYVRSRKGMEDSTNNNRINRQLQYLDSLHDKTKERIKSDDEFIVESILKLSDYIVSDRSVTQLQEIMRKFNEYEFSGIESIKGESKMGEKHMEFYPDEDSLKEMVIKLFYE